MSVNLDRWLTLLNAQTNEILFEGPRGQITWNAFRRWVVQLQRQVSEQYSETWVLYDLDGAAFFAALFALLSEGKNVIVPSNLNQFLSQLSEERPGADQHLDNFSVKNSSLKLIGADSQFKGVFDINLDRVLVRCDDNSLTHLKKHCCWGKVAFSTSGSTGNPKLVWKTASQLFEEAELFQSIWQYEPGTTFIPLVPHLHIYGLAFSFMLPLVSKGVIYLPRNAGMLGVTEPMATADNAALVIVTSPTLGRQVERIKTLSENASLADPAMGPNIIRVYSAGGVLSAENAENIQRLFRCPITEIFGSTETGAIAKRIRDQVSQSGGDFYWQLFAGIDANLETNIHLGNELLVWGGHVGGSQEQPVSTGDFVKAIDTSQFLLAGRVNDICKIEGKRISLSHLTSIISSSELIDEAIVMPFEQNNKEIFCCGVVLSAQGLSNFSERGKMTVDKEIRHFLLSRLEPVLVPRIFRYLDQIPSNEMSKRPKSQLKEILLSNEKCNFPEVEVIERQPHTISLKLLIPVELKYFRGHFDTRPIVPGVILLHWIYLIVEEYLSLRLKFNSVNKLKFSHPVGPKDSLRLVIVCTERGIEFKYTGEDGELRASGQIPVYKEG